MTRAERKRQRRLEAGGVVEQVEGESQDFDSAVCIMTRASGGSNGAGAAWGG